ncbi:glutamate racemase [Deinococcus sonorensis]|uniref:Glutamate racemase n=2 Tax=Deinococcus sonorensis TaxID=309891 RepID=A0AAU7U9P4_9DEIO
MSAAAPVGVFDSGVGGLSVLAELRRELPAEDFLYYADSAHAPYGERSPAEVEQLTRSAIQWLREQGCKAVVIACNTACAFSLASVRAWVGDGLPVIGLVPALKPAVAATRSGVVGVFATPVTLEGSLLRDVVAQFAQPAGIRVLPLWHNGMVPAVEAGQQDAPATDTALRDLLTPAADQGMDTLVLGCTHYPFLVPAIRRSFGDRFALFDSGRGVARRTRQVLTERGLLNPVGGQVRYLTTGNPAQVQPVVRQLMQEDVAVTGIRIEVPL